MVGKIPSHAYPYAIFWSTKSGARELLMHIMEIAITYFIIS